MHDLFGWALQMCDGRHEWHNSEPLPWQDGVDRFFRALQAFDDRLATGAPLGFSAASIFQGPIADALTHVGNWRCCAVWPAARCPARITSWPTSRWERWGSTSPRR